MNAFVLKFNEFVGVAYIIDTELGNCTVAPLSDSPNFDVFSIDSTSVKMKSVAELFGVDGKKGAMNWTYTGQVGSFSLVLVLCLA